MVDFTLGMSTILVCKSIETDRGKLNFIFNSPTWLITHNLRLNQFVFYHWNQESNFSEPKQEKTAMLFPRSWLQTGTSPLEEKDFTVQLKYCSLCGSHSQDKNLNHVLIWVIQIFFSFLVFTLLMLVPHATFAKYFSFVNCVQFISYIFAPLVKGISFLSSYHQQRPSCLGGVTCFFDNRFTTTILWMT